MNKKIIVSGVVTLALFATAMVSPFGLPAASAVIAEQKAEEVRRNTYAHNLDTVEGLLLNAVNEFNDSRTFDVYYGDITRLHEVLAGIAGITVSETVKVDPMNGYLDAGYIVDSDSVSAVRFMLLTDDPATAIGVLQRMQLPIYEISWQSPNSLSVTFLTGGAV